MFVHRVPGNQTFRHVQVDRVQRHVVHGGRNVDDDVHLAVERGVARPQERYDPQTIRVRDHGRRQPNVRRVETVLQPFVVHATYLVQNCLGGPERAAAGR